MLLEEIKTALESIDGSASGPYVFNYAVPQVVIREMYMDEIHDFPTLMVTNQNIQFIQMSNNLRHKVYSCRIRGIVYDENSVEAAEKLAQDIEYVLEHYDWSFEEVRIIRVETDAGLNAPFGAVIISFLVLDRSIYE
jgi:hypothetical protein